jgi:hypothetical protein
LGRHQTADLTLGSHHQSTGFHLDGRAHESVKVFQRNVLGVKFSNGVHQGWDLEESIHKK